MYTTYNWSLLNVWLSFIYQHFQNWGFDVLQHRSEKKNHTLHKNNGILLQTATSLACILQYRLVSFFFSKFKAHHFPKHEGIAAGHVTLHKQTGAQSLNHWPSVRHLLTISTTIFDQSALHTRCSQRKYTDSYIYVCVYIYININIIHLYIL